MLAIRLFRVGKKKQPCFKIVVTDKRRPPRGGRFVEQVGFLNPLKKEKILREARIKYWLSVGAKPSATVYNLLVSGKIIEGKKIPKHSKPLPAVALAKVGKKGPAPSVPEEMKTPSLEEKKETPAEVKSPEANAAGSR